MRRKIIAGNWKMNCIQSEAKTLIKDLQPSFNTGVEVIVFPPCIYVEGFIESGFEKINFGSQNHSQFALGAYTGEISASMLKSIGVQYALVGHSERREYFNETDELLRIKVDIALENDLKVIYCCGETIQIRQSGKHLSFVIDQLEKALSHLTVQQLENLIIAYEPVWAIGTGLTASSVQAQEMHNEIRRFFIKQWGQKSADSLHILYGGSLNSGNARELLSMPDIDGGLIGGASLKSEVFNEIISIAASLV